jgi:ring-1,2-phenylacetyl-CoA epoxidase subunit PaaA
MTLQRLLQSNSKIGEYPMANKFTAEMKKRSGTQGEPPPRRQFAPGAFDSADLKSGRLDRNYTRTLVRLLAAHALAEKLSAVGYERALKTVSNPQLRPIIEKNLDEERMHTRLVYQLLDELGVDEAHADRSMILALKSPSFEAPRYFAERAEGELDLAMASISLDTTGFIMIDANYKNSSYAPHGRAARIILEDEAEHDEFATSELLEMAERFGAAKVDQGLREWIPRAVNFFGPPESEFTDDCIRFGLKVQDNGELADLYLSTLEQRVQHAGLEMPLLTPQYPHQLA